MTGQNDGRQLRAAHETLLAAIRAAKGSMMAMDVLKDELQRRMYDKVPEDARAEVFGALLETGSTLMFLGTLPGVINAYLAVQCDWAVEELSDLVHEYNSSLADDGVPLGLTQRYVGDGNTIPFICAAAAIPMIEAEGLLHKELDRVKVDPILSQVQGTYALSVDVLPAGSAAMPEELIERLEGILHRFVEGPPEGDPMDEIRRMYGDDTEGLQRCLEKTNCGNPDCPIHGHLNRPDEADGNEPETGDQPGWDAEAGGVDSDPINAELGSANDN